MKKTEEELYAREVVKKTEKKTPGAKVFGPGAQAWPVLVHSELAKMVHFKLDGDTSAV